MSQSNFLKPFLLTGVLAATLGAGSANAQVRTPIPTKATTSLRPVDSIVVNTTLTADKLWILKGYTIVKAGVTLTIEPGTTIEGEADTKATLLVDRGGYLVARGTREQPITFQGSGLARGSWGGITILGKGISNQGGDLQYEALPWAEYGAGDANDSSGVLTYLRLIGPGFPVAVDRELNGLTLCAVGRRTVVNHIQIHRGDDDGIEWFGGSVNTSHLVVTGAVDDSYDTDHGYIGNSQYMIAIQSAEPPRQRPGGAFPSEIVGDRGLECGSGIGNAPHTMPVWKNITFIENGKSGGAFEAKEECGGSYEDMVLVAGGATAADTSDWVFQFISDQTVAGIAHPTAPHIDFKDAFVFGKWKTLFLVGEVTGNPDADLIAKEILDTKIKNFPVQTLGNYGLYKDLRPAHPEVISAGAGAIVGSDLWYQGWTLPGTLVFDLGVEPPGNAGAPAVTLTRTGGTLYAPASFTLNAAATDADGITSLQILAGTTVLATSASGTLSFAIGNLPVGTHTYTVKATDGHLSPMTGTGTLEVAVSQANTAPTVSLTRTGGDLVGPASFTLNALASDPDGIASLQILLGDEVIGTSATGTLSVNLSNRMANTYTYTVRATDSHQNPLTSSGSLIVVIAAPPANVAPVVTLTRPDGTLFAPAGFTLIATATDPDGIATLEILSGNEVLEITESGALTVNLSGKEAGSYTYKVRATDGHASEPLTSTMELVVTVFDPPADENTSGPITLISRSGAEYLVAPADFELRGQADDADGISAIEIIMDDELVADGTSGTLSHDLSDLPAGTYVFTVRATDNHADVKRTSTKELTVVVHAPNTAPAVTLSRTGEDLMDGDDFTLNAAAEDADGIASLEILLNGVVKGSSTTGSLSVPIENLPPGTYVYVVRATDKHTHEARTSTRDLQVVVGERPTSIAMRELSDITAFGARGQDLVVDTKGYGKVTLSLWSLSGKRIQARAVNLTQGRNLISMGLVRGVHIVRVSDGRKTRSARVVFNVGD